MKTTNINDFNNCIASLVFQGCPIGIAKNPEISGSSRKSSPLGARKMLRVSKVQWVGGGGVVAEPSKAKSVDSSKYNLHRCQHQLTKKRDRADEKAGVSIFHTTRGRNCLLYYIV